MLDLSVSFFFSHSASFANDLTELSVINNSDPKQVAWAKSFLNLLDALQKYVRQYHMTGVVWNPKVREREREGELVSIKFDIPQFFGLDTKIRVNMGFRTC